MLSVLNSDRFSDVCDSLLEMWSDCIEVYTDRSLQYAGFAKVAGKMAAYFSAADASIEIRGHSGVVGNVKIDVLVNEATSLSFSLPVGIRKRFMIAEKSAVSDNTCYFVRDLHQLICCAHWETGLGFDIVSNVMIREIDWRTTAAIWHPDSYMLFGFTSRKSANLCTYLIKAVYK
ncbi:hypothetical protein G9A89_016071 [Geosiphon pyriformis]|nr:hypothetical protein G9A89_016071 [Geosiphon pyriformis]